MSVVWTLLAVYAIGYAIAFVLTVEDDGPMAFVIGFCWPPLIIVITYLVAVDNIHNRRARKRAQAARPTTTETPR